MAENNTNGNPTASRQQPVTRSQTAQQSRGQTNQFSQADLNRIVLEYLNKKGYHRTENMLRLESTNSPTPSTGLPSTATTVLANPNELTNNGQDNDKDSRDDLRELKDPEIYGVVYNALKKWVENSLDLYKPELSKILYPIFIHCYLELIYNNFSTQAKNFFEKFKFDHEILHGLELDSLNGILLPDHLNENELAKNYRSHKYRIIISKTSIDLLLYFLHENEAIGGAILIRIINQYLNPITKITQPDKLQLPGDANPEEGLLFDESTNEIEKFNDSNAVSLGKLPLETDVAMEVEAELKVKDEQNKAKLQELDDKDNGNEPNDHQSDNNEPVKKTLVEEFHEMQSVDENSPTVTLPLPLKDANDIKRLIKEVEDSRSKIKLNSIQATAPSVCMYTFHNSNNDLASLEFNQDSTIVAGGFQDSYIKLWSIDGKPLKSIFKKDKYNNDNIRKLVGHSGPVYSTSFSPDNKFLISGSEDKTIRLWSLDTFSGLVSYKGHNQPVWDVKFSPLGHYFASASHDQTARLWATDHIYPLRIFAGHINDVDCVEFHPNSNYVFTGSSDKTCRMWDVHSGNTVRVFVGHTGPVNCMAVSPDGRWLASAGEDSVINVWDCGSGRKLKSMRGHGRSSIYSLAFSKDNGVLVSGGADNTVRVWDVRKNTNDSGPEPESLSFDNDNTTSTNGSSNPNSVAKSSKREIVASSDHMTAYFTKKTPVFKVHFTRRNLCLAAGPFLG